MNQIDDAPGTVEFGTRDAKGYWKPPYPASFSPLFDWPIKIMAILKYIFGYPGYLWPINTFWLLLSLVTTTFFQPPITSCKNLEFGWISLMFLRNLVIMLIVYGGLHLVLYTYRLHGNVRKYHPSFQDEYKKQFLFGRQPLDNAFRCLVSALPVWTAYEVLYVWAAANGKVPYITFQDHPVWFVAWLILIPVVRETHFYFTHRSIHWKPLYRTIHYIHHLNINPGPWSGLAMHPLEHLIYFSVPLLLFIIPSNLWHMLFITQQLATGPASGHLGFEGPLFNGKLVIGDYFHYLHHKHFTCNFGGTTVPWDRWLGVYFGGEGEYRARNRPAKPEAGAG
jgi:sterol desaturase/sphingolipid hydroxylase (fatty acid hydroxylase superfamily)